MFVTFAYTGCIELIIDFHLLTFLPASTVSNTGGDSPNAALRLRLTSRSLSRATTSFALSVTLGSLDSLRSSGTNSRILFAVAAALPLGVAAAVDESDDAPRLPSRKPSFPALCMAGVGSGSVSATRLSALVTAPDE